VAKLLLFLGTQDPPFSHCKKTFPSVYSMLLCLVAVAFTLLHDFLIVQ
jgi:hypothetical protein